MPHAPVNILPKLGPSRSELMQEETLQNLGKGLGSFFTSHMANSSLDKLLSDPSFEQMPLSKKMQKLSQTLEPYGEQGQKTLMNHLQIEQQSQQEKQQRSLSNIIDKISNGKQLDSKDLEGLPAKDQFEILKTQNEANKYKSDQNKKKNENQEQVDIADRMADNAGMPHLKGNKFPPAIMDKMIKAELKKNKPQKPEKRSKEEIKQEEETETYKAGLDVVNRMKHLRKQGHLGRGSGAIAFFGGQAAKDRGEYEQLGKSLISLSTNIPIRNRLEFDTLAHKLYDPSLPDKEAEGVLNAMQRILENNIKKRSGGIENEKKPPLTSYYE